MKVLIAAARQAGIWIATLIDQYIGWYRFSPFWGLILLVGIRSRLRDKNLTHTSVGLPLPHAGQGPSLGHNPPLPACRRTPDGTWNDLRYPTMGAAGTPLGRNVPLSAVRPETYAPHQPYTSQPNPRQVSEELLKRTTFQDAGDLNVLAAAWIQFMVHDWFSHGPTPAPGKSEEIEIPRWKPDDKPMHIPRTRADHTRPPCAAALGPTFINDVTHWWDGSQLYGSDHRKLEQIRHGAEHGKIKMDDHDLLPLDQDKHRGYHRADLTGFNENWWVGLSLMHTLFAREHNLICDHLRHEPKYKDWNEEDLFAHARLITAAVIAKIHTVEWTPAILNNPTVAIGMRGSWRGLWDEGGKYRLLAYLFGHEVRDGIRSSPTDHHEKPYAMTEEFVSVYRMHTLLPDDLHLRRLHSKREEVVEMEQAIFGNARDLIAPGRFSLEDIAYSFGLQPAGAITLHNYPNFLRELKLPNGQILDLAAVDIVRDRERGVPRYNEFRRLVGRRPVSSFGELVGTKGRQKKWHDHLRDVYGDVDSVDLMVGLFAEQPPPGFGFSDTAFRIFLLMAGRRLKSDRFFTTDFTEKVYTPEGIAWIDDRTMAKVLMENMPELKTELKIDGADLKNPFHRWNLPTNRTPM